MMIRRSVGACCLDAVEPSCPWLSDGQAIPSARCMVSAMALVTFQVIDGFEKGRVYSDLLTPVTIGREEDNLIQLNDERVSRFHAKIQEDGGRLILTDLDSTNGTRVNGHPVQMRVLQTGDQVTLGRSLLIFGSEQQIADRIRQLQPPPDEARGSENQTVAIPDSQASRGDKARSFPSAKDDAVADDQVRDLFPDGPPELPIEMRPVQSAQLSDVLAYVHEQLARIADVAAEVKSPTGATEMRADWVTWQRLLKLEMQLAVYMRRIADPDG